MKDIIKTAGVLVFRDQDVLLIRHGEKAGSLNNTYGLPAGRLETGESSIKAAVRELLEETGLKTTEEHLTRVPGKYTATIERKKGVKTFCYKTFLCNKYDGELKATEETVPEWTNLNELDKLKLLPNVKIIIFNALKLKQNNA